MKSIIVDDERLARREMRSLLGEIPNVEIIGEAGSGEEAIEMISVLKPNLVLLDINMPGMNGFEVLEHLPKDCKSRVIFTTAHDEYAIQAFKVNAIDYLLKPIEPERLNEAIARAFEILEPHSNLTSSSMDIGQEQEVISNAPLKAGDPVLVREGEKCWFVNVSDIWLLESEGNYTKLYFGDKHAVILRSLAALEERLDSGVFFRANRRQIFNLQYVQSVEPWFSNSYRIMLKGNMEIDLSRRQSRVFREKLSI